MIRNSKFSSTNMSLVIVYIKTQKREVGESYTKYFKCLAVTSNQATAMYVWGINKCIAIEQVAVHNAKFRFLDYISDFGKIAPRSVIAFQNKQANKIKVTICFGLLLNVALKSQAILKILFTHCLLVKTQ